MKKLLPILIFSFLFQSCISYKSVNFNDIKNEKKQKFEVSKLDKTIMYFFILQGEGGTGKTFLINLLSQWSEMILRKPGDLTNYPKTIRLAATGNAAHLIGK